MWSTVRSIHTKFHVFKKCVTIINLLSGWCDNYNNNIVDIKELQSEIDTYMSEYDQISAERVRIEKETVDNEDEDGWKTVTKKYIFINFIQFDIAKSTICYDFLQKCDISWLF